MELNGKFPLRFYVQGKLYIVGTKIFAPHFFLLYSPDFSQKLRRKPEKLKSITMYPLRLAQKEPKNARKCQTLIFEIEGWFVFMIYSTNVPKTAAEFSKFSATSWKMKLQQNSIHLSDPLITANFRQNSTKIGEIWKNSATLPRPFRKKSQKKRTIADIWTLQ